MFFWVSKIQVPLLSVFVSLIVCFHAMGQGGCLRFSCQIHILAHRKEEGPKKVLLFPWWSLLGSSAEEPSCRFHAALLHGHIRYREIGKSHHCFCWSSHQQKLGDKDWLWLSTICSSLCTNCSFCPWRASHLYLPQSTDNVWIFSRASPLVREFLEGMNDHLSLKP